MYAAAWCILLSKVRCAPWHGSAKRAKPSAVDLTLVDASGNALEMPTAFDDFSERAHRDSPGPTPTARVNAAFPERAMTAEGFIPFPTEWWHFDGPGWEAYPLGEEAVGKK